MLIESEIDFSTEDVELPDLDWDRVERWIRVTMEQESAEVGSIRIRLCSDDYLLEMNRQYLEHDYYTDILTFPLSYNPIDTDIMISLDRVIDHARERGLDKKDELLRVIIHGCLHMCGYDDQSEDEKQQMRTLENEYLALWSEDTI